MLLTNQGEGLIREMQANINLFLRNYYLHYIIFLELLTLSFYMVFP